MGEYSARAMKIQEVILRAISGQILWMQAAEIIGIGDRSAVDCFLQVFTSGSSTYP